ncbi:MAG: hypothetical protein LBM60_05920, partial [Clostridium sp.]|nr:hypothetical protein [Clostridium sp.]
AGLTNLTSRDVDSNNISDISVLAGLTKLDFLILANNPLTQNQVDELQDALPNCYISALSLTAPVVADLTNDDILNILIDQVYNDECFALYLDSTYTLDSGMQVQLLEYGRFQYDDEYDGVAVRIKVSCVSGQASLVENDLMLLHDGDGTQQNPILDVPFAAGDMITEENLSFPITITQNPREFAIGYVIPSASEDVAFVCTNLLNGSSAGPMYIFMSPEADSDS